MSFRHPDAELRVKGWPAVIIVAVLFVDAGAALIHFVLMLEKYL